MTCLPLAVLLAALLAQYGEVLVHAGMADGTPILTTRSTSGAWTRIAVFGPHGCILVGGPSEPVETPEKKDGDT